MARACPQCGLINPNEAQRCDCGYNLVRHDNIAPGTHELPDGTKCPACGCEYYDAVRPNRWIGFQYDRICKHCKQRYKPPTPIWAAILFIFIGLVLGGLGSSSIAYRILTLEGTSFSLLVTVIEGLVAALGIASLAYGLTRLSRRK